MSDIYTEKTTLELSEFPGIENIIKVVGVGGGGSNAVNYIYEQHIEGVDCIAINTDAKSLMQLSIPNKLAIARHGSGANPQVSKIAAESFEAEIASLIKGAEMVFIAAGMGKGTGTGASPVVARIAKELGVLTIGVVTIPFKFEGERFVNRAIEGLDEMRQHVDSLLIIANEQIKSIYGNHKISMAFSRANDVIATAIRGITGAVTSTQGICTDMEDMRTTLKSGQNIMMGVGIGDGPNRAIIAIRNALESPLLINNSIRGGQRIIINYAMSTEYEMTVEEMEIINDELKNQVGYYGDQIWGTLFDENLGTRLKVTIVVTGINGISNEELIDKTLGENKSAKPVESVTPFPAGIQTFEPVQPQQQQPVQVQPVEAPVQQVVEQHDVLVETIPQEEKKVFQPKLDDLFNNDFISKIENETPNWGENAFNNNSSAFIGSDPKNPIVHNNFLNNNVD